uniref:Female-specific protein transformer n=1 Tax=Glossina morsitans morsitans TaxID=37546 RepID=A0A1B0G8M1_GLOMM
MTYGNADKAIKESSCLKELHTGEGSKPLFPRLDTTANSCGDRRDSEENSECVGEKKNESKRHLSRTTSESTSPERYREPPGKSIVGRGSDSYKTRLRKSESFDNIPTCSRYVKESRERKKSFYSHNEIRGRALSKKKVPYFLDEVRERDRLKRLYGKEERKSHSKSPSRYKRRYRSPRRYHRSSSSRRSKSKDRKYRHFRESRRRSKSRSRTRSPRRRHRSRSRRNYSSSRDREHKILNISNKDAQLPGQFITIPVALPAGSPFPYTGFHQLPPPAPYPSFSVMPAMHQRKLRPMPVMHQRMLRPMPGMPQLRPMPRRTFFMPPVPFLGASGRQLFVTRNDLD